MSSLTPTPDSQELNSNTTVILQWCSVVAIEKGAFESSSTTVASFTLHTAKYS